MTHPEYDGFYHLTTRGWIAGAQWREGLLVGDEHPATPDDALATYRLHIPAGDPDDRTFTETWRRASVPGGQIEELAARFPHPVGPPETDMPTDRQRGPSAASAGSVAAQPDAQAGTAPGRSPTVQVQPQSEPAHDATRAPGDSVERRDDGPVFPAHGGPG